MLNYKKLYLGEFEISRVYLGNVIVYGSNIIEYQTLTIEVNVTDYKIFINNIEVIGTSFELEKDSTNIVRLEKQYYTFDPESISVVMDADKTITFVGIEIEDPDYVVGAVPMELKLYDGTQIPILPDGWYGGVEWGTDIVYSATISDLILDVGDSFGFKNSVGTKTTLQLTPNATFPEAWSDAAGIDVNFLELFEIDWDFGGATYIEDLPEGGWVFLKREDVNILGIYHYTNYNSEPILLHSFGVSKSTYKYPYFTFWEGLSSVQHPQLLSASFVTFNLNISVANVADYKIFINNIERFQTSIALRENSTNTVRLTKDGYIFDPIETTVTMDSNKTITFEAIAIPDRTIYVGDGDGSLILNGVDFDNYDTIIVREGYYDAINIINFDRLTTPVKITNQGLVNPYGLRIENSKGVHLIGDNESEIQYGFSIKDNTYRPIRFVGLLQNITISNLSVEDCGDYFIFHTGEIVYDGTLGTRLDNIRIVNNSFNNVGDIQLPGYLDDEWDVNLYSNFEFAYNNLYDCGVLRVQNAANYNVHHNTIELFQVGGTRHDGIFWFDGSGKTHSNKIIGPYYGNIIRAWCFDRLEFPGGIEFYNNIGYNSQKYSLIEVQGFSERLITGKTKVSDILCYNNTGISLGTLNDWYGVIIDTYSFLGTVTMYNNLGADMHIDNGYVTSDEGMVNLQGTSVNQSGNRYFVNPLDAVEDLINFKSKIPGVGAGEIEDSSEESFRPVYSTDTENTSPWGYYEYLPEGYNNAVELPLLIFLHGSGEKGDGTSGQLSRIVGSSIPKLGYNDQYHENFITLSPQWLDNATENWYDATLLKEFIEYAKTKYKVNTNKIYLTGLSAGGGYVLYYLEHYPTTHEIAASAILSTSLETDYTTASGVATADSPIWWLSNIGDNTVPWTGPRSSYIGITNSATAINAINPNLVAKLTGFDVSSHDGGTWDGVYNNSLIGQGNSSYDIFDESIYDWLLRHQLL